MDVTREKTDIRLYTGSYCPYCRRVKQELDRLGLDYEPVNADEDGRQEVIRLSGQRRLTPFSGRLRRYNPFCRIR